MKKSIGVIGGKGMLGSDLVRYLSPKFSVTSITKENYEVNIGTSFDVIINANGNSKRFWANEHVLEDFKISTSSVYKSMFDFHCETYIYISSPDLYDRHESPRFTSEIEKVNPVELSSYGFHKYLSEIIVRKYAQNYLVLRCSMILGTNMKKGPFYDIFHGNPLYISRDSRLQMITTEEVANIIAFIVGEGIPREVFNVGGRETVLFRNLHKYVGKPISFSKSGERQIYEMDVSKLSKLYPVKTSEAYLEQFLRTI